MIWITASVILKVIFFKRIFFKQINSQQIEVHTFL